MTITLNTTITQRIDKSDRIYGSVGDKVELIADHENVLIVENKKGERFSVNREKIKEYATIAD